jgi:ATP-binding cassette subfamily F protein uup
LAVLESFIDDFNGAIIFVSHDRFFVDRLADKVFAYGEDGTLTMYPGGYSYWKEKQLEMEAAQEVAADSKPKEKQEAEPKPEKPKAARKLTFKEQKEYAEIEGLIASKEGELKVTQLQMAQNAADYGRLNELSKEESRLQQELEHLMERWAYLEEIAEEQG